MVNTARSKMPWRLVFGYVLDWIFIIGTAAVGGGLSFVEPYKRTFSLADEAISYPYRNEVISTGLLVVLSLVVPAVIIVIVAAISSPSLSVRSSWSKRKFWTRKIWEINAGLMGLGLSFVLALLLTQMVKNLFGRPRPDFIARCMPEQSVLDAVGATVSDITTIYNTMDVSICTNTDTSILNDGFRSFFSGHASSSWSGLLYLSLWLASKMNLTLPYIQPYTARDLEMAAARDQVTLPLHNAESSKRKALSSHNNTEFYRHTGAAAPIYAVIIALLPILLAVYITSTRYQEFKHKGVDLTVGALVGSGFALLGYRSYHSSLTRGQAWTWAPRSHESAFLIRQTHFEEKRRDSENGDGRVQHDDAPK